MAQTKKAKAKKTLHQRFMLKRVSLPLGVVIAAILTPVAFAFAVLALNMALQDPTPITAGQEKIVRDLISEKFKSTKATDEKSCPVQPALNQQQDFEYKNIRINRTGDRAILQRCNNTGVLLAKTSGGVWFALTNIDPRPEGAQDYQTRKVCKIEDITLGFNDTFSENVSLRASIQKDCRDVDAAYTAQQK